MYERLNTATIFLGTTGSGKTFYTRQFIDALLKKNPDKKILVASDEPHPNYQDLPFIHYKDLRAWRRGVYFTYSEDIEQMITAFNKLTNALIIFEDATNFIENKIPTYIKQLIIRKKQKNIDLIFMFHGFMECPPIMFRQCDSLLLFKSDNPEKRKKEICKIDLIQAAYLKNLKSSEKYPKQFVKLK